MDCLRRQLQQQTLYYARERSLKKKLKSEPIL